MPPHSPGPALQSPPGLFLPSSQPGEPATPSVPEVGPGHRRHLQHHLSAAHYAQPGPQGQRQPLLPGAATAAHPWPLAPPRGWFLLPCCPHPSLPSALFLYFHESPSFRRRQSGDKPTGSRELLANRLGQTFPGIFSLKDRGFLGRRRQRMNLWWQGALGGCVCWREQPGAHSYGPAYSWSCSGAQ